MSNFWCKFLVRCIHTSTLCALLLYNENALLSIAILFSHRKTTSKLNFGMETKFVLVQVYVASRMKNLRIAIESIHYQCRMLRFMSIKCLLFITKTFFCSDLHKETRVFFSLFVFGPFSGRFLWFECVCLFLFLVYFIQYRIQICSRWMNG